MGFTTALAIGGAALGIYSSKKAADAEEDAAQAASSQERAMFQQTREDFAPFREAGVSALERYRQTAIEGDPSAFFQSPGYQFGLGEGQKAIERAAAARGQYFTPKTVSALGRYQQDYATKEYQNYLTNLRGIIDVGSGVTSNLANLRSQSAGRLGGYAGDIGTAQAGGYLGAGEAISGGLENLASIYEAKQKQGINALLPTS